jgi:hypothetical protein
MLKAHDGDVAARIVVSAVDAAGNERVLTKKIKVA